MNIHDKLAEIQAQLHAPKDKQNTFGKYAYRNAEGIIAAFKALNSGASLTMSETLTEVAGHIFVTSTAMITFNGESMSCTGNAMHPLEKKGMDASQITGAATSYARKYALGGLFAIDDSSDDPDSKDNSNDAGNKPLQKSAAKQNKTQERNPDQIRDALIAQVNKCQTSDQVNDVIGAAKFDAAWQWLAENHEPHSAAVRSAVDAKKNATSRDLGGDSIPY